MTPNISSVSDIASFPCEIMPILRDFNAVYRVLPHIHAFLLIYGFVCQITLIIHQCGGEMFGASFSLIFEAV